MGFLGIVSAVLVALVLTGLADMNLLVALTPLLCEYLIRIYKTYKQLQQLKALQEELKDLKNEKDNS